MSYPQQQTIHGVLDNMKSLPRPPTIYLELREEELKEAVQDALSMTAQFEVQAVSIASIIWSRFRKYHHLRLKGNTLHIRSPRRRKDHLFWALPSHLKIKTRCCRGDRVSILSWDRRLLLDISGLGAYMKEFCATGSELGGELCVDLLKFLEK